jgi:hypothetical protein
MKMPTGKTCGNCQCFIRIKGWGNERNGLCDKFDYGNCHSDSSYAKKCKGYEAKKYERTGKHNMMPLPAPPATEAEGDHEQ